MLLLLPYLDKATPTKSTVIPICTSVCVCVCVCVQSFHVSRQTMAMVWMPVFGSLNFLVLVLVNHYWTWIMITLGEGVCMNMVKESALNDSSKVKVDSGRKVLCHTGILIVILGNQSCTGVSFVNDFFGPVFHQVHLSCPAPSVHMCTWYTCKL